MFGADRPEDFWKSTLPHWLKRASFYPRKFFGLMGLEASISSAVFLLWKWKSIGRMKWVISRNSFNLWGIDIWFVNSISYQSVHATIRSRGKVFCHFLIFFFLLSEAILLVASSFFLFDEAKLFCGFVIFFIWQNEAFCGFVIFFMTNRGNLWRRHFL